MYVSYMVGFNSNLCLYLLQVSSLFKKLYLKYSKKYTYCLPYCLKSKSIQTLIILEKDRDFFSLHLNLHNMNNSLNKGIPFKSLSLFREFL